MNSECQTVIHLEEYHPAQLTPDLYQKVLHAHWRLGRLELRLTQRQCANFIFSESFNRPFCAFRDQYLWNDAQFPNKQDVFFKDISVAAWLECFSSFHPQELDANDPDLQELQTPQYNTIDEQYYCAVVKTIVSRTWDSSKHRYESNNPAPHVDGINHLVYALTLLYAGSRLPAAILERAHPSTAWPHRSTALLATHGLPPPVDLSGLVGAMGGMTIGAPQTLAEGDGLMVTLQGLLVTAEEEAAANPAEEDIVGPLINKLAETTLGVAPPAEEDLEI